MTLHNKITELIINKKIYTYLAITLVIGIVLMLIGRNGLNTENSIPASSDELSLVSEENKGDTVEYKLINILKKVEGVGEIDIIINYTSTAEKIPLFEASAHSTSSRIVTITDGSKSEPFIRTELNPDIEGVVIVAKGGDNINTANTLRTTVSSYLGVPVHKISVLKMK